MGRLRPRLALPLAVDVESPHYAVTEALSLKRNSVPRLPVLINYPSPLSSKVSRGRERGTKATMTRDTGQGRPHQLDEADGTIGRVVPALTAS